MSNTVDEAARLLRMSLSVTATDQQGAVDALCREIERLRAGQFNINDKVRVRLTDFGRKAHRTNHNRLFGTWKTPPEYTPPIEDADGWSTWQMWNLMAEFGGVLVNGFTVPFETTIELVPNA